MQAGKFAVHRLCRRNVNVVVLAIGQAQAERHRAEMAIQTGMAVGKSAGVLGRYIRCQRGEPLQRDGKASIDFIAGAPAVIAAEDARIVGEAITRAAERNLFA